MRQSVTSSQGEDGCSKNGLKGKTMLLFGYTKKIFRPEWDFNFDSAHCLARLNEDVSEVLPYLNTVLGGEQYNNTPPEVVFHLRGKIIKVGAREIAINALKDAEEADRVLAWLKTEINQTWENRAVIIPSYTGKTKPKLIEILRLLPKTNCKKCGQSTCMVFASQVMDSMQSVDHCPELNDEYRSRLSNYLNEFILE